MGVILAFDIHSLQSVSPSSFSGCHFKESQTDFSTQIIFYLSCLICSALKPKNESNLKNKTKLFSSEGKEQNG